ncbi:MAG: pyruvate dehydrogenase (acetyl-transferring) E1 component subunit alpha [Chlamydiae bacterium]|jgi:pyruvate dehydrogenase E1 component alpha subunit|nr:pyruvate dehydrogenase (acetyl-transferring) E1 component subunit alpha [Chlamydiota bacterium]
MEKKKNGKYNFFPCDQEEVLRSLGKDKLLSILRSMLLIRNFEVRAESAYLQGKIGGFFHSYMGQEAIQTSAVAAIGPSNWWTTSYRCHALALLLGATPNELMAELYGKVTGNAKGRGGSMHFFTDRMLGGHGIVGGQIPIATGAAFTSKYLDKKELSLCFMGEGAVAQGSFHESLNLASLWSLPCIYVIENNKWGMGTGVNRAICVEPIAEMKAPGYNMKSYTLDGMDFFSCYAGFSHIGKEVLKTSRPVLVEVITERFRGHSISDPGLYRSKDELSTCMQQNDPIALFMKKLVQLKMITDEEYQEMDKQEKDKVLASMKFAEESPWPDPILLGEDVFAP